MASQLYHQETFSVQQFLHCKNRQYFNCCKKCCWLLWNKFIMRGSTRTRATGLNTVSWRQRWGGRKEERFDSEINSHSKTLEMHAYFWRKLLTIRVQNCNSGKSPTVQTVSYQYLGVNIWQIISFTISFLKSLNFWLWLSISVQYHTSMFFESDTWYYYIITTLPVADSQNKTTPIHINIATIKTEWGMAQKLSSSL